MDWKLENVLLPVADVDRAKEFYARVGFHLDVDHQPNDEFRVVQFTPPGSACSVTFGIGVTHGKAGSVEGLHLVVTDVEAAHAELVERGIDVSEPYHFGPQGQAPGVDPARCRLQHVRLVQRSRRQQLARARARLRHGRRVSITRPRSARGRPARARGRRPADARSARAAPPTPSRP